jgi:hypothetical protein
MPYRTGRAPLARRRLRSSAMILLVGASLLVVTACTAGATDAAEPTPVAGTTTPTAVASTTPAPPSTTRSTPPPLLIPPSVVATAEPVPPLGYDVPSIPTTVTTGYVPAPPVDNGASTPPPAPSEPTTPPPSPVDSRGFPLGTTCSAVSCTSPDGVTFVNPDALPNLGDQPFQQLCEQTICPPGFQLSPGLPSTGSAG